MDKNDNAGPPPTGGRDRMYLVRVRFPSTPGAPTLALGVVVEGDHVDLMMPRAEREGLDREGCYRAVAVDSLRIVLQRAGWDMADGRVLEVREVDEAELAGLLEGYRSARERHGHVIGEVPPPPGGRR